MDPITALGVAAAVVAFVDFAITLTRVASQIHGSSTGETADNVANAEEAENFQTAVSDLKKLHGATFLDSKWTAMVSKCNAASGELLALLDDLKAKNPNSKREAGRAAFKALWNKNRVKTLKRTVEGYRGQLHFLISKDTLLQSDESFQRLISYACSNRDKLEDMHKSIKALTQGRESQTLYPETVTKLQELLKRVTDANDQAHRSRRILEALSFSEINQRYGEIGAEHNASLDWLINDTGPLADCDEGYNEMIANERTRFIEWLREPGQRLFQICGKLGCGKSVVMRWVSGHSQTRAYLTEWAQADDSQISLVMGRVFLKKDGTNSLQRSRSGLVRTLLHSILTDSPNLIPLLFPAEWAASTFYHEMLSYDANSLEKAFETLKSSPQVYKGHKIVIFIDGIDEINSLADFSVTDPVRELRDWVNGNSNVKICLACREIPVIQRKLAKFPLLQLHTVSRGGIAKFVRDTLAVEMEDLSDEDEDVNELKTETLAQLIIEKSDGIFLWVSFILRDVVDGLNNANALETLWKKATALPKTLSEMFRAILKSIKDEDKVQADRFLSLVLASHGPCPLLRLSLLEEYQKNHDFADGHLPQMSPDQLGNRLRNVRHQVKGICAGLLEIVDDPQQPELTFRAPVRFAHGSIAEFLDDSPEDFGMMAKGLDEPFDSFRALCETFRAHNKSAGNALAKYAAATIWEFDDGIPSFEFDVYRLLQLSKIEDPQFDFSDFLKKAVDEICAMHPAGDTARRKLSAR
ncbi:uncharacterized protein DSM5745_08666 [Aspergillus mulundensis]|uniref:NACHT domain-containing protein n=1 Tax=Aspergillus mulundensis TaxID=1810919 RepID=A0A3D8R4K2_9EURO|nr:hypothetical protein DSM5745_08666 [Aspergillus mulundensis]RDW68906.1 hypothetical protein DSM5745_08666 [Aspergillus mulundensis]